MIRANCANTITTILSTKRCGKQFRSRVPHKLCRACYYLLNKTGRPIDRVKKERVIRTKTTTPTVTTKRKK